MFNPLLLTDLLVGEALLHGFELSGGAVLIRAANVDSVVAHEPALALVHIG